MFLYKLLLCLWISFFWFFAAQGVEISFPQLISNVENKDCINKPEKPSNCKTQLNEEELYQSYREQILEHFSDTLFENSFCECDGNNGCTRGCRLASYLDKNQTLPFRKCRRSKPMYKSSEYCAKHVTGAIMTVLHDFLAKHCQDIGERMPKNKTDYDQCEKDFIKNANSRNTSICRHGFIFPFAFCMLNLDRQGLHVYNRIPNKNKEVKRVCKAWDPYNQSLLAMDASLHYGETTIIPLFQRVSPKKDKEFQREPYKIPEGSLIITKLYGEEGHVEVKTNRKECGKHKNETCFCSDYCRERHKYHYPVLAVFRWNPEFIRHVSRVGFEWNLRSGHQPLE